MRWLVALVLLSCSPEVEPDPCEEWTWIDEEGCSGDVCGNQGADSYECRDGECWCCLDEECWDG